MCIALCTIVAHNIAQNRPDSFPPYPPDNHHCSDDVYTISHHHNRFTALFPGPPGWAGLDFMVQGKINRGRHTDHPAGCHSIRTNQCLPPPSPIFFTGQMPFLPPNQQRQSTEGSYNHTRIILGAHELISSPAQSQDHPQQCPLYHFLQNVQSVIRAVTESRHFSETETLAKTQVSRYEMSHRHLGLGRDKTRLRHNSNAWDIARHRQQDMIQAKTLRIRLRRDWDAIKDDMQRFFGC